MNKKEIKKALFDLFTKEAEFQIIHADSFKGATYKAIAIEIKNFRAMTAHHKPMFKKLTNNSEFRKIAKEYLAMTESR